MFIVENHLRMYLQLMSFATNSWDLGDSVLYDCLIVFCRATHQKLLSDRSNIETAEKIMADRNIDPIYWIQNFET